MDVALVGVCSGVNERRLKSAPNLGSFDLSSPHSHPTDVDRQRKDMVVGTTLGTTTSLAVNGMKFTTATHCKA